MWSGNGSSARASRPKQQWRHEADASVIDADGVLAGVLPKVQPKKHGEQVLRALDDLAATTG